MEEDPGGKDIKRETASYGHDLIEKKEGRH